MNGYFAKYRNIYTSRLGTKPNAFTATWAAACLAALRFLKSDREETYLIPLRITDELNLGSWIPTGFSEEMVKCLLSISILLFQ